MKEIAFVLGSKVDRVKERFVIPNIVELPELEPKYNIRPGDFTTAIVDNQKRNLESFRFGLPGLHAHDRPILFVRSEGDRNKNDDPFYKGTQAIFLKPEFRPYITSQRCMIIVDAYVVGFEEETPHLVFMQCKKRPFALAAIYNTGTNPDTGEKETSFAILTCTANALMQKLGHKRMPVILHLEQESTWLHTSSSLTNVLNCLNPYPASHMNAYPVSDRILNRENNDLQLLQPIGATIYAEQKEWVYVRKKKPLREPSNKLSWGELVKLEASKKNN